MAQQRQGPIESNWENLKDKVKASLDKVVEAVGSYPVGPEDMGLITVDGVMPLAPARKRTARKPVRAKSQRTVKAAGGRLAVATKPKRRPAVAARKRASKSASGARKSA